MECFQCINFANSHLLAASSNYGKYTYPSFTTYQVEEDFSLGQTLSGALALADQKRDELLVTDHRPIRTYTMSGELTERLRHKS